MISLMWVENMVKVRLDNLKEAKVPRSFGNTNIIW